MNLGYHQLCGRTMDVKIQVKLYWIPWKKKEFIHLLQSHTTHNKIERFWQKLEDSISSIEEIEDCIFRYNMIRAQVALKCHGCGLLIECFWKIVYFDFWFEDLECFFYAFWFLLGRRILANGIFITVVYPITANTWENLSDAISNAPTMKTNIEILIKLWWNFVQQTIDL